MPASIAEGIHLAAELQACRGWRRRIDEGLVDRRMKTWPRALAMILALSALLALATSAGATSAPPVQTPETGWIIWETSSPIQRLALDGDSLWAGAYKGGLF